jgi:hypothetical protein
MSSRPYVLRDGTIIDEATAERIVSEVDAAVESGQATVSLPRRRGRPALSGSAAPSPRLELRVPPELRERATRAAEERGVTISELVRDALEAYLAT